MNKKEIKTDVTAAIASLLPAVVEHAGSVVRDAGGGGAWGGHLTDPSQERLLKRLTRLTTPQRRADTLKTPCNIAMD